MSRILLLLACLLAPAATMAFPSSMTITTTCAGDSVVLDVHIVDQGGAPDCYAFGIERRAWSPCGPSTSIGCIPRVAGNRAAFETWLRRLGGKS